MAILKYTTLRLLLFVAAAALLYLVGLRGFLLLIVALLVSGVVSLVVLSRSRDDVSSAISNRVSEVNRRIDERAAAEDHLTGEPPQPRVRPVEPGLAEPGRAEPREGERPSGT
jgi:Protein of unknown function (DUF4229)